MKKVFLVTKTYSDLEHHVEVIEPAFEQECDAISAVGELKEEDASGGFYRYEYEPMELVCKKEPKKLSLEELSRLEKFIFETASFEQERVMERQLLLQAIKNAKGE